MVSAAATSPSRIGVAGNVLLVAEHLLCLSFPAATLLFLAGGPYTPLESLGWLAAIAAMVLVDMHAPLSHRQPAADVASWPFNAILYVLVLLQAVTVLLLVERLAAGTGGYSDTVMALLIVGINSGYSAIVVAHELIHRPQSHLQLMGRFLLVTVMYEHFFTEHIRGHHARVGTDEDPATARYGESFGHFFRRTVPGQFRSAWHLENRRLGDEDMRLWDRRMLGNRVLHGLLVEVLLATAIGWAFGPAGLAGFLVQAFVAIRLLEVVNYFEHWGLRRSGRKVRPVDSWDADSAVTLYSLVGLSRHADHHAHAARPYQQLRHHDESPKLPYGYFGMVVLVLFRNTLCQRLMTKELRRRHLGPFAPPASEQSATH